jgi:hypothetical protein
MIKRMIKPGHSRGGGRVGHKIQRLELTPFSSLSDPSAWERLRIHRRLNGCTSWVPADRLRLQPYPTRRIAEPRVVMDEELVSGNRTLSSSPM